jgi:very-short-patch-repair endonuclease
MAYLGRTIEFRLHYGASQELINLSKKLRRTMTPSEKIVWHELRNRNLSGCKFRRQHAVHLYIVDFFCLEKELVIEIDGGIHNCEEVQEKDGNRTAELERLGLTVIRFTNEEVLSDIDDVMRKIDEISNSLPASPSP